MSIIESYSFGRMSVDGKSYSKDVIIYPDGHILSPWWRRQGHFLAVEDLTELIASAPDIIICGTGAMGVMRVSEQVKEHMLELGIEFIARKSSEAVDSFNRMATTGKKVGGCFHLTC